MLPPEPCSVTVEPCIRAPLDLVLYDQALPIDSDLPPADDEDIREACPFPRDISTLDDLPGETTGSLIHSDFGYGVSDHGGQPVTVHEFLQGVMKSKAGRKYGRRNRLGTVQLDAHDRSEQCRRRPSSTSNCHMESQTRNDLDDQRISACPLGRVQSKRLPRRVPHLRRKKRFAKSLAQRLFEADVFSSGTSSRSTGVTPDQDQDQNPAHTSSRRPLQFITSLSLTPSLESRIYGKKKTQQPHSSSGSADSEIQPESQEAEDSVPDSFLQEGCCPAIATFSGGGKPSSRNWSGATGTTRKRTRARASPAVMRGSGKRAFLRTRHGGGKQSSAQVPHNPFEYVPLPLVRVETASASRIRRTGATASATVRKPQSYTVQAGAGHAHKHHMRAYRSNFN